jgi:quinolinate synthase
VVTSSIALEIVEHLDSQGHKIIWGRTATSAPTSRRRQAPMLRWQGSHASHDEFRQAPARAQGPEPGCRRAGAPGVPASVIELADAVGSTSQLIKAARELPQRS